MMKNYALPQAKNNIGKEISLELPDVTDDNIDMSKISEILSKTLGESICVEDIVNAGDDTYCLYLSDKIQEFGNMIDVHEIPGKVIIERMNGKTTNTHLGIRT